MIQVTLYHNADGAVYRFKVHNHGDSIVCAAVSALVITAVNFITERFDVAVKQKHKNREFIDFELLVIEDGPRLAIEQMVYGLRLIEGGYQDQIKIHHK